MNYDSLKQINERFTLLRTAGFFVLFSELVHAENGLDIYPSK